VDAILGGAASGAAPPPALLERLRATYRVERVAEQTLDLYRAAAARFARRSGR